jgi:hypothetical protein
MTTPTDAIKPIETRYAGCRFRSRLEARWAVFFDALEIRWEYEPQGYVLDGRPYLPDFKLFLPEVDEASVFAEVKGADIDEYDGEHVELCRALADVTGHPVVLLAGVPSHRMYRLFSAGLPSGDSQAAFFCSYGERLVTADGYWFQSVTLNEATGALEFTHDARGLRKSFGPGLVEAISAARSARFEHGERG